jgi:hypothetical protein
MFFGSIFAEEKVEDRTLRKPRGRAGAADELAIEHAGSKSDGGDLI